MNGKNISYELTNKNLERHLRKIGSEKDFLIKEEYLI